MSEHRPPRVRPERGKPRAPAPLGTRDALVSTLGALLRELTRGRVRRRTLIPAALAAVLAVLAYFLGRSQP